MSEVYFGAAFIGLLSGALVGNAANRVVSKGLDAAVGGAQRALENIRGSDPTDPETRYVLQELDKMDMTSKLRITQSLVDTVEAQTPAELLEQGETSTDPLVLSIVEVKDGLREIAGVLGEIKHELTLHQTRTLHKWRYSNVGPMLERIHDKLAILDKRVEMMVRCMSIVGRRYSAHVPVDSVS